VEGPWAVFSYRSYAGRLSAEDADRYVDEMVCVAELLGLPSDMAPRPMGKLREYLRGVGGGPRGGGRSRTCRGSRAGCTACHGSSRRPCRCGSPSSASRGSSRSSRSRPPRSATPRTASKPLPESARSALSLGGPHNSDAGLVGISFEREVHELGGGVDGTGVCAVGESG